MKQKPASAPRSPPRARILEAAIELFALHGFEAVTMRQLGDAVGLDNSSLYRHFASKSALAHAALDQVIADFGAAMAQLVDLRQPATLAALESFAGAAGAYFFERQAGARLMLHWLMSMGARGDGFDVSVPATDARRPSGQVFTILRAWLDDGVRRGGLRKHAMPDAAVILLGAVLLRPATYGHLLASLEPRRTRDMALKAWQAELRIAVRGAFSP
jgi:AcrR family transcriptional regulator